MKIWGRNMTIVTREFRFVCKNCFIQHFVNTISSDNRAYLNIWGMCRPLFLSEKIQPMYELNVTLCLSTFVTGYIMPRKLCFNLKKLMWGKTCRTWLDRIPMDTAFLDAINEDEIMYPKYRFSSCIVVC